jgi:hypothetical protein
VLKMNHIFSQCPFYSVERDMFFEELCKLNKNFTFLSNSDKFLWLMINEDIKVIVKLCEYLVKTFKKRSEAVKLQKCI